MLLGIFMLDTNTNFLLRFSSISILSGILVTPVFGQTFNGTYNVYNHEIFDAPISPSTRGQGSNDHFYRLRIHDDSSLTISSGESVFGQDISIFQNSHSSENLPTLTMNGGRLIGSWNGTNYHLVTRRSM